MSHPKLYVLRHGQTEWNAEGRLQGALDSPLTAEGHAQAARQADILTAAGVRAPIYSSPQGRALQTARIIARITGAPVFETDALREVSMGAWDGQLIEDVTSDPGVLWKFDAPQGDRLPDMQARLRQFLDTLDSPAILVTHGVTSRVLRALVLAVPDDGLADMDGGQGVVFKLANGQQQKLT